MLHLSDRLAPEDRKYLLKPGKAGFNLAQVAVYQPYRVARIDAVAGKELSA